MEAKGKITLHTLIYCLIFNGILVLAFYMAAKEVLDGIYEWLSPLLSQGGQGLPQNAQLALSNLNAFLSPIKTYLAPAVFGAGATLTLLLWLTVQGQGRRLIDLGLQRVRETELEPGKDREQEQFESKQESMLIDQETSYRSAVQILSILQRQGRLIDFLQEDLNMFDDAQIGAAVRNIHEDCKKALQEYVKLEPIFDQEEGTEVTVAKDFDVHSIRLTGNVSGEPPFRGVLRHRGWRIARIELPVITAGKEEQKIIAPAEVEVNE